MLNALSALSHALEYGGVRDYGEQMGPSSISNSSAPHPLKITMLLWMIVECYIWLKEILAPPISLTIRFSCSLCWRPDHRGLSRGLWRVGILWAHCLASGRMKAPLQVYHQYEWSSKSPILWTITSTLVPIKILVVDLLVALDVRKIPGWSHFMPIGACAL